MGAEELAREDLPAEPASVARARRVVAQALRDVVDDDVLSSALVIASELATNAMLHARTSFEVVVRWDDTGLRIEVQDGSPRLPRRKRYSDQSATGRGLVLVESLASLAGAEQNQRGKVVWAVIVPAVPTPPVAEQAAADDAAAHPTPVGGLSLAPDVEPGERVAAAETAPEVVGGPGGEVCT